MRTPLDLRRLEVFCKVVELKSFTKAAEALMLSQPTVSEHLRNLEDTLGERMVDRLGREVIPTPAGKVLYQYARNIIQLSEDAVQAVQAFKGKLSGNLIVGASTIPGTYILPGLIGSFKTEHSDVQITLRISDTAEIVEQILDRKLEAGLIGSKWNNRKLELEESFPDELVLVAFPGHPWESRKEIAPDELEGQPFILRERGSGTRAVMSAILQDHGFETSRLDVVAEMGSTEAVRQGIKERVGISILSRHAVDEDIRTGLLKAVGLKGVRFLRPFYLVQRRGRQPSPVCSAFLAHLRDESQG
jgi:DNA-binding transcriptional LysR family regulator